MRFPIEEGRILEFARAIGDSNPIYCDRDYAATTPFGGLLAPPTFAFTANVFDPDYVGRPRPGQAWPPAGRGRGQVGDEYHGEQHFEYRRHPVAGEVLDVQSRPGRTWSRTGRRGGGLSFTETLTDLSDERGLVVISGRYIVVATEREVDAGERSTVASTGSPDSTVLVDGLTRTQIVMYAGATGDYQPLHHDEHLARELGYPTIFPHGMFVMGLAGRLVTDSYGDGTLLSYSARFLQPVWPGDRLIGSAVPVAARPATGPVDGSEPPVITLRIEVATQDGVVAMSGQAIVRAA